MRYDALGTSFVSDVLELVFDIDDAPSLINDDWEAVMWALFTAAAKILEVPETELGEPCTKTRHMAFPFLFTMTSREELAMRVNSVIESSSLLKRHIK